MEILSGLYAMILLAMKQQAALPPYNPFALDDEKDEKK